MPAGYRTGDCLRFLRRDAEGLSERVCDPGFEKAFLQGESPRQVSVRFAAGVAHCETDALDGLSVVRRLLGLHCNSAAFEARFHNDPLLGPLIARQRGLHIPLTATPWEGIAWAILGQQINLSFAISLRRELIRNFGVRHSSGLIAHPDPATIAAIEIPTLRALKFSTSKADYLTGAAKTLLLGALPGVSPAGSSDYIQGAPVLEKALRSIRGFGPWTVQYVMLRAFGYPDCLPASDSGLAQALERLPGVERRLTEKELAELFARYAPDRSLATCHLWASL